VLAQCVSTGKPFRFLPARRRRERVSPLFLFIFRRPGLHPGALQLRALDAIANRNA